MTNNWLTYIIDKFSISAEREDYSVIHGTMEKGIYFRGTNLWILIFAILMACVGLDVNSTAVLTGAMLISPLMGPILGMGYSIAIYDFNLFKKAFVNLGFAVAASLLTSTLYFLITPMNEAHSELLARTQPNIYDVIVALVGGLAGVLALSSKQKGNVIIGAAIATALMPPLCTAGYGLASGNWYYFFGAFYLFTINAVFIGVATLITVRVLKYPVWNRADQSLRKSANRWVTVISLVTVIPSIYLGYVLVQRERFSQQANTFVRNETHIEGDYLLKADIDPVRKTIKLVYGGKTIADSTRKALLARSVPYALQGATITIRQGFAVSDQDNALLSVGDARDQELALLKSQLSASLQKEDSINQVLSMGAILLPELKSFYPYVTGCSVSRQMMFSDSAKSRPYLGLFLKTNDRKKLSAERAKIEAWFKKRMQADSVGVYID